MSPFSEIASMNPFGAPGTVQPVPSIGSQAPSTRIAFPRDDGKPVVVLFMRHCGCPVAEKDLHRLRAEAQRYAGVHFIAVSHSALDATSRWLDLVGGAGNVEILIDPNRDIYTAYGLGRASVFAMLNLPRELSALFRLKRQGYVLRATEDGNRWQTGGLAAIAADGTVKYAHAATWTNDTGDFDAAIAAVNAASARNSKL